MATNEEKLKRLFSLMDEDSLTKEEFKKQWKTVLELVKKLKDENSKSMSDFGVLVKKVESKLNGDNSNNLANIKADFKTELDGLKKKYSDFMANVELRVAELRDGADGKDANEDEMIERLKNEVPTIEQIKKDLPVMGEEVRDALELLQGEERLDVDAISGLKELLKEAKERPLGSGGGGFSYMAMSRHFVESATPVGTVNGTNKIFTVEKAPNPTTSLKMYVNGQRMKITEDYTLSGVTATFVTAPLTGSILMYDLRY